jgi:hypothetical protein
MDNGLLLHRHIPISRSYSVFLDLYILPSDLAHLEVGLWSFEGALKLCPLFRS